MHWLILLLLIPYIYILLRIFLNLLKLTPYTGIDSASTFVSIIIAARNEESNLPLLLNDISSQDYPPGLFEVIVIDDNSTDATYETAAEFKKIYNLRVYRNAGKGKKSAIRTGVRYAYGNLIITVDADCRLNKEWLKTIISFYEKEKPDMIISPVILKGSEGFFQRFQELEFLSLQGITAGSAIVGDPVMCNGANLCFTKESYERHAMDLHEELASGDDIFLLHSMKKDNKERILWLESQSATVTSETSPSIKSFIIQRARWISKAGVYKDVSTKILAIITLTAVMVQIASLVACIFTTDFFVVFAVVFLLKSVPDYLILLNTTARYRKKSLMRWFPAAQFVYPFYVITVIAASISCRKKNR